MAKYVVDIDEGVLPSKSWLSCYDTIGGREQQLGSPDDWTFDRDELLHHRSAYEFIRAELTANQRADLDQIDDYWKAHPQHFNSAFDVFHYRADKKVELEGFVKDEAGNTPAIPKSHWWWWPLKTENKQ